MSHASPDQQQDSQWDELRFVLKTVTPFAAFVWTATLCWVLSNDLWWSLSGATAVTSVISATLFCDPRWVRTAWLAGVQFATIGALIAALYSGIKLTELLVAWMLQFPANHPYLFAGGILLVLVVLAAGMEDDATRRRHSQHSPSSDQRPSNPGTRFAHGPPFPADSTKSDTRARKKIRKRRRWKIEERRMYWINGGKRCYYCNIELESWRGEHMHLDHLVPFSRNGSDTKANIVTACPECNVEKQNKVYPELHPDSEAVKRGAP